MYQGIALLGELQIEQLVYAETEDAGVWTYINEDIPEILTEDAALTLIYKKESVRRVYTFNDTFIKAVVTVDDAEAIPDDAHLEVTPVTQGSIYDYDAYIEALDTFSDYNHTAENTLLYDFALMIPVRDEEGNLTGQFAEYQPEGDTLHVSVTFKNNQITDELEAVNTDAVEVVHLPLTEEVRETIDSTAEAGSLSAENIDVQPLGDEVSVDLDGKTDDVTFSTDSFSVYAFTVDFHYNSVDYSIPGHTQILLSDLIELLHITVEDDGDHDLENDVLVEVDEVVSV